MLQKNKMPKIDESWLTTYSDMVSLLLCFFVLLVAVSRPDLAKFEQVRSGMSEGISGRETSRPIEMMMLELTEDIKSVEDNDNIGLGSDTRGVVLEFGNDMLFEHGSAKIKPEVTPLLKRIAATLKSDRYRNFSFSIEGHTSDQKFSNSQFPSNWELSSARASSVARFLEARGIERTRMRVVGMYDIAPKYPNFDPFGEPIPQNRQKNRRVSIHIEPIFERQ